RRVIARKKRRRAHNAANQWCSALRVAVLTPAIAFGVVPRIPPAKASWKSPTRMHHETRFQMAAVSGVERRGRRGEQLERSRRTISLGLVAPCDLSKPPISRDSEVTVDNFQVLGIARPNGRHIIMVVRSDKV